MECHFQHNDIVHKNDGPGHSLYLCRGLPILVNPVHNAIFIPISHENLLIISPTTGVAHSIVSNIITEQGLGQLFDQCIFGPAVYQVHKIISLGFILELKHRFRISTRPHYSLEHTGAAMTIKRQPPAATSNHTSSCQDKTPASLKSAAAGCEAGGRLPTKHPQCPRLVIAIVYYSLIGSAQTPAAVWQPSDSQLRPAQTCWRMPHSQRPNGLVQRRQPLGR